MQVLFGLFVTAVLYNQTIICTNYLLLCAVIDGMVLLFVIACGKGCINVESTWCAKLVPLYFA